MKNSFESGNVVKKSLFLAGLAFIWSSAVIAGQECQVGGGGPVKEVLFTAEVNCHLAEILAVTLHKTAQFSPRQPDITLIIGDRAGNASFDNGSVIRIPQFLFFTDSKGNVFPASNDQLEKVVVHEYGHAVLKELWKTEFADEFSELFQDLELLSSLAVENTKNKISGRGVRQRGQQIAMTDAYSLFYKTLPAYSELYADALTVLYFADSTAMFKALHFAHLSEEKSLSVELRDFSQEHRLSKVEKSNDAHTRLSLVRSYVGRMMRNLDEVGRKELLARVEQAITLAVREELRSPGQTSALGENLRLIEFLQNLDPANRPFEMTE